VVIFTFLGTHVMELLSHVPVDIKDMIQMYVNYRPPPLAPPTMILKTRVHGVFCKDMHIIRTGDGACLKRWEPHHMTYAWFVRVLKHNKYGSTVHACGHAKICHSANYGDADGPCFWCLPRPNDHEYT
jgi:hypothetical protein